MRLGMRTFAICSVWRRRSLRDLRGWHDPDTLVASPATVDDPSRLSEPHDDAETEDEAGTGSVKCRRAARDHSAAQPASADGRRSAEASHPLHQPHDQHDDYERTNDSVTKHCCLPLIPSRFVLASTVSVRTDGCIGAGPFPNTSQLVFLSRASVQLETRTVVVATMLTPGRCPPAWHPLYETCDLQGCAEQDSSPSSSGEETVRAPPTA